MMTSARPEHRLTDAQWEGVEVAIVMLAWIVIWVVVIQEVRCGFCSF